VGRIRDGRLEYGVADKSDKVIWQSKLFPDLVMTERILNFLHLRYSIVKSWHPLMLDLEKYLTIHPNKTPKDFKKFILNCAKRHAEDVQKGYRFPDGKVNLKAFAHRGPDKITRDPSIMVQARKINISELREKLKSMDHDSPEYERMLNEMRKLEHSQPDAMSIGDVFAKLADLSNTKKEK
jgi:hypothetical protein